MASNDHLHSVPFTVFPSIRPNSVDDRHPFPCPFDSNHGNGTEWIMDDIMDTFRHCIDCDDYGD